MNLKTFVILIVLTTSLPAGIAARGKKYDERGNPITSETTKADVPATPGVTSATAPVATPEVSKPDSQTTLPVEPAKAEADEANEEAEAARAVKNAPTKVFLENAELYHRSSRPERTFENLKKSQEAGEDEFSREAKLKGLFLRARRGDAGLESEAEGFDDKLKMQAYLAIADGYQACAREQTKKNDCLREAERLFAYAGELQPRSREGRLARLRLALLLLETGRHEAALPHLTRTLLNEGNNPQAYEAPLDRAYFMLGQLYERPWYHKDGHKAEAAYRQVLKFPGSPYAAAAKERLQYLTRFSTGAARP